MELRTYQQEIISEVEGYVQQNKKRISVILPTGCGVTTLACVIANEILTNTIVIIRTLELCDSFRKIQEELYPESKVLISPINRFKVKREEAFEIRTELIGKSYLLLGTTPNDRKLLKEVIPMDSTIICMDRDLLFQDYSHETVNIESIIGRVFYADELYDVRDVISSNENDSRLIFEQILTHKSKAEKLVCVYKTMPYNASPEASDDELEAMKKMLAERDRKIAEQEELIRIYKSLLSSIVPVEELNRIVDNIIEKKNQLKSQNDKYEYVIEQTANLIADYCKTQLAPYVTDYNKAHFSSLIKACLTENVWNKMSVESKNCVITSKVAYESLQKADPDDKMDYSGVCILAAKALDIEISKRFVHQYIDYLKENKAMEQWPHVFFDKNKELLEDENFTLGTIQFIVGINECGEIKNYYVYKMFCEYARNKLYTKRLNNNELKTHLTKCVQCVEKVRNDYRNPAAHRTTLNSITAKECLDYLIDTYKKMKEILIYMN